MFGFVAVFLIGPILAVASILLSFALAVVAFAFIGFVFWLPFQVFFQGKHGAWRRDMDAGVKLGRRAFGCAGTVCIRAVRFGKVMKDRTSRAADFLASFLVETVSGALAGLAVVL